jgi:competence CoiA-like predicted nuclease
MNEKDHRLLQKNFIKIHPFLKREVLFSDICRIADLVWEEKKIIFEIQCSEISSLEAARRTRDYGMKGYEVIWILDDRVFSNHSFLNGYLFSFKEKIFYKKQPPEKRKKKKNQALSKEIYRMKSVVFATVPIVLLF